MFKLPTPHIEAKKEDISKNVLMPGDPLRARFIAENFLTDVKCVNSVRNMLAYTGNYNGKSVTIMGSGMGMPSIGIYSYELFKFYDVDKIIRIGSAGSVDDNVKLKDIIIAMGACTDSNYSKHYNLNGQFAPIGDFNLISRAKKEVEDLNCKYFIGNVYSTDVFYNDLEVLKSWQKMGILAVEMEAAALYMNSAYLGKSALCLLTISDSPLKNESISSSERQIGFGNMAQLGLNTIIS